MAAARSARKREAERYRAAADEVLGQLDWVIQYLHQIRKHRLATALDRNRRSIADRLR